MTRDEITARLAQLRLILGEPNKAKLDYSDEIREIAFAVVRLPGADVAALQGMTAKASLDTVEDIEQLARLAAAAGPAPVIVH